MAAALLLGRCNPYGAEDGGPRGVLGGLHGPASAAHPDESLPLSVQQGEWSCPWPAAVRVRMECRCGHIGKVMELCSVHDEDTWTGEMVAGTIRRVKRTIRVRGHYEEISRRQAGACPRCLYPRMHAEAHHSLMAWQGELGILRERGMWRTRQADRVRGNIEAICEQFDRGNADGTIHRCPLTLIPVS